MIHWVRGVCAGGVCAVAMIFCAIGCGTGVEEIGPAPEDETPPGPSVEDMERLKQESMERGGIKGPRPKGK